MFEQLDVVSVTGAVLHAVSVFILCPLIVYFLVQFTKIRHEKVCKYRVVWLCQLNNGVVLIGLVLEPSYILITRVLVAVELPSWIGFLILSITWWAAMSLFAIKVFVISAAAHNPTTDLTLRHHIALRSHSTFQVPSALRTAVQREHRQDVDGQTGAE